VLKLAEKADGQQPDNSTGPELIDVRAFVAAEAGVPAEHADAFFHSLCQVLEAAPWESGVQLYMVAPGEDVPVCSAEPGMMSMAAVLHRDGSMTVRPTAEQLAAQLRHIKEHQSADWLYTWGHVIDWAIRAQGGGRGRKATKAQAAVALWNKYLQDDRVPSDWLKRQVCKEVGCNKKTLENALKRQGNAV
jgi:hypothetical protein